MDTSAKTANRNRAQRRGNKEGPRWMRDVELAEELNISRAMVHRLRCAGMPSLAVGRARRYDAAECVEWLRHRDAS